MPSLWMPGAKIIRANTDGGSMTGGERLATFHYYVCPMSMSPVAGAKYLNDTRKQVHFLFNALTGETVQMIPMNRAGRGLRNEAGGVQTNRRGIVNPQIEVMANSPHWWKEMTPAGLEGFKRLIAFFRSWGIPDQWAGIPGKTNDTPNGRSGYTGHNNWVENDHGDYLSKAPWEVVGGSANASAKAAPKTTPGKYLTVNGQLNAGTVKVMQRWLGFKGKAVDGIIGPNTIKALQKKIGAGVDGIFRQESARKLEKYLGAKPETIRGWYPGLVRSLQRYLNAQIKAGKL